MMTWVSSRKVSDDQAFPWAALQIRWRYHWEGLPGWRNVAHPGSLLRPEADQSWKLFPEFLWFRDHALLKYPVSNASVCYNQVHLLWFFSVPEFHCFCKCNPDFRYKYSFDIQTCNIHMLTLLYFLFFAFYHTIYLFILHVFLKLNKNCWRETCINYMMAWKTM